MRHVLMVAALLLSLGAVALATSNRSLPRQGSSSVEAHPTATVARGLDPQLPRNDVENARYVARSLALGMGEKNPVLIDEKKTTLGQALATIHGSKDGAPPSIDKEQAVYVVRMRGRFHSPRSPVSGPRKSVHGWMYSISDASTGQMIDTGFGPGNPPVHPPAPAPAR